MCYYQVFIFKFIFYFLTENRRLNVIQIVMHHVGICSDRQITIEEGEQRAKELNVMFIETSAKTGSNVKQVSLKALQCLLNGKWT